MCQVENRVISAFGKVKSKCKHISVLFMYSANAVHLKRRYILSQYQKSSLHADRLITIQVCILRIMPVSVGLQCFVYTELSRVGTRRVSS